MVFNHGLVQTPFRGGMAQNSSISHEVLPPVPEEIPSGESLSLPFSLGLLEAGQPWLCIVLVDYSSNSTHSELFLITPSRGFSSNYLLF